MSNTKKMYINIAVDIENCEAEVSVSDEALGAEEGPAGFSWLPATQDNIMLLVKHRPVGNVKLDEGRVFWNVFLGSRQIGSHTLYEGAQDILINYYRKYGADND